MIYVNMREYKLHGTVYRTIYNYIKMPYGRIEGQEFLRGTGGHYMSDTLP
jgi:hypothetical protein